MDAVDKESGLTPDEHEVMHLLMDVASAYALLPVQHPDEPKDFVDSIHRCQDMLAVRIARRLYPGGWPTYGD